jgi:hypothetical protein
MFAFRKPAKEDAAPTRPERAPGYGTVLCPKCETKIEIAGGARIVAEEFSIRCTGCHSRSFHTRSAITSAIAAKTGG